MSHIDGIPAADGLRHDVVAGFHPTNTSSSPISEVPHELLVMIFEHATAGDETRFEYNMGPDSEPDARQAYAQACTALRLAHVCCYWRQTALATPSLWTRIDGRQHERKEMYMRRSQYLPVSLYIELEAQDLVSSLHVAPAERLRRLDLHLDSFQTHTHVEPLATWTARNLECLTMLASEEHYSWAAMQHPLARVQLLNGHVDALKALALQYLGSWVPSNTFPSLTHLHLSFSATAAVEVSDIRVVLANAPSLEFVLIGQLYGLDDAERALPGTTILGRLRSLALVCCKYAAAMSLVEQLVLPEQCFVRLSDLSIYSDPSHEGEPAALTGAGPLHHPTKLDIATAQYEMLLVADSETSGYWVQAHRDDLRTTWDSWFRNLPSMMTLSTITSLHINIDAAHTFWSPVLRHMSAVTELKAVICETWPERPLPIDVFCALLSEDPVLLPSLRDLHVQGTSDYKNVTTLASESAGFMDMVVYRARAGHRLRRLLVQPDCEARAQTAPHDPFRSRYAELVANVDAVELVGFGAALCRYEMRDVWRVDGADQYWKPQEEDRACYVLPKLLSYWV